MKRQADGGGFDPTTRSADFAALKSTLFDAAQQERFPRCLLRSQQGEICSPEQLSQLERHCVIGKQRSLTGTQCFRNPPEVDKEEQRSKDRALGDSTCD